ncbi:MAG: putative DNA binding domain-containing protein [Clostridiales bacterium]|nr:putative DNA binding domain-containing protein [Clostridiales bacterium]
MLESQTVECKREYNDKVNKTLLAFLNTGGGTLYIGIADDGTVCGVPDDLNAQLRKVSASFRDSVSPDPSGYFSAEMEMREGKPIIKVSVERGSAIPYCFDRYGLTPQGVYVRVGSSTVTATREHIRQMIRDNGSGKYITELSIEQNLSFLYADKVFAEKDVKFGYSQKQSLGLIHPDGRFTNLALLLSDQCPHTTKAAIFEGTNKENFKDRKEFSGSLFRQIDEMLSYLHIFNRIHGSVQGVYRVDRPDYPEISLKEAYLNALIHRDYYLEGSVLVSMFDNRIEFISLGGVMPGVTYDLMLTGVSVARNEKLAQIFYRLNLIEAFGTGIPRIFSAYAESKAKPEIPVVNGGFLMRLPNVNYNAESAPVVETKTANTYAERLSAKFGRESFTKEDAAALLGIGANGAYKLLQRMKDKGLLAAQKTGKNWTYSIMDSLV